MITASEFFDLVGEDDSSGFYKIAVTSDPKQLFTFSINGVSYKIYISYNSIGGLWQLTLTDVSNSTVLCSCLALQYGRLALGDWNTDICLAVIDKSSSRISPVTLNDMGNRCGIYIIDKTAYRSVWP